MAVRVTALVVMLVVFAVAVPVGAAAQGSADVAGSESRVGTLVDPGDSSRNTSTAGQQAGVADETGTLDPASGERSGVPHSVTHPLDPTPTLEQPDGTTFEARFWSAGPTGGWRTVDGYTVLRGADGYWYYATRGDGRLVPGDARVGIDRVPASVPTGLAPSVGTDSATVGTDEVPPTGTQEIPIVAINFSDTAKSYAPSEFQSLLFGDDPDIATGPGSVTDYYEENSGGQLTLTGDVSGWETADNGESYYGDGGIGDGGSPTGAAELVKEAAQKADDQVDFAQYDNDDDCLVDQFATIHQGGGQEVTRQTEDIWSHRWSLASGTGSAYVTDDSSPGCSTIYVNGYTIQPETYGGQIATIGVYAHEFGHGLGLPDLYDTDGSSAGIGEWGLMGSGSYGSVVRSGDAPNHMTAWTKAYLGWLDPPTVAAGESQDGVSLANVSKNNEYLRLLEGDTNPNGEYFYVENRQQVGFDQGVPGEGLLVTHINESRLADDCVFSNSCNDDENNKLVDIEAADGNGDLDDGTNRGDAGDPWDEGTGPFDGGSTPSSDYDDGSSSNVAVSAIDFSAGSSQGTATFDASVESATPATFVVTVTGTNAPVTAGETLSVGATVENTGDLNGTQTVSLDGGALGTNATTVSLAGNTSTGVTLTLDTAPGDDGNYTATVSTDDDSANQSVTVAAPATPSLSGLDIAGQGANATVTEGDSRNVSVSVANVGDRTGSFEVALALDSSVVETQSTGELAGGADETLTFGNVTGGLAEGTYAVNVSAGDTVASGLLTIEGRFDLRFPDQNASEQAGAVVRNVSSDGVASHLLVTYEDSGETVVAGVANGTFGDESVTVTFGAFVGFPAEYTAHLLPVSEASGPYAPGDTLSANTSSAVVTSRTARVTTVTGAPDVPVVGAPAMDTTGDGLLDDVRGDGGLDIFDVQTLFDRMDDPVVDDNAEFFDFQAGSTPVSIFDVQALFSLYQDQG